MNQQLFRQKSIDRVSSPEQLNEYIRVSNPGVWLVLGAIVLLLVGVCAWGVLGHLDTTLPVAAVAENGEVTLYVKARDAVALEVGMGVAVADLEGQVVSVSGEPLAVDESFSDYALHLGSLQRGEWVYAVAVSCVLPDGIYEARITTERVAPISFVIN